MSLDMPSSDPPPPGDKAEDAKPKYPRTSTIAWLQRRRERAVAEIERNRRGEYRVPTWVLAAALAAVVVAWIALIIFASP